MGDLRLMSTSSSSRSALLPGFSTRTHKVCERGVILRDQQQLGRSWIASHPERKFQLRASLNDLRPPFSFSSGEEDGPPFKEVEDLGILDRLALAWRVLFPKRKKLVTPAEIAKQRLKMILISDRCSVNDKAKRKIVNNIVGALTNFVEIESQDSVRLNVSADPDLGTVYSVSVPVRRVKPEFQDNGEDVKDDEFRDGKMSEGNFEFPAPDIEQSKTFSVISESAEACGSLAGVKEVEG